MWRQTFVSRPDHPLQVSPEAYTRLTPCQELEGTPPTVDDGSDFLHEEWQLFAAACKVQSADEFEEPTQHAQLSLTAKLVHVHHFTLNLSRHECSFNRPEFNAQSLLPERFHHCLRSCSSMPLHLYTSQRWLSLSAVLAIRSCLQHYHGCLPTSALYHLRTRA